ncbi:MAG: acyltransferase family protein [Methylococcales bacterium]|nr:acyltransferase family protein [Methylococcales bacterium]
MNNQKTNRYYWLDVTKFIGIFLIVLCHFPISKYTAKFLWTFHVPLFFFISGYLFKTTTAKDFLEKLSFRLIRPYIYIYLLTVLLTVVIKADYNGAHIGQMVLGLFWGTHRYPYFINSALWFLPALITVQLLYFFGVQKSKYVYLALLAVSVYLYSNAYLNLFFSLDLALLGLNFFMAGVLAKKYSLVERVKSQPQLLLFLFVSSLWATFDFAFMDNVWFAGKHYTVSLLGGLLGITMTVTLSLLVENLGKPSALISYISASTLSIFCFHVFSNPVATVIVDSLAIKPLLLSALLATVLSILMLLPVNWLIVKYIPELVGIKRPL